MFGKCSEMIYFTKLHVLLNVRKVTRNNEILFQFKRLELFFSNVCVSFFHVELECFYKTKNNLSCENVEFFLLIWTEV